MGVNKGLEKIELDSIPKQRGYTILNREYHYFEPLYDLSSFCEKQYKKLLSLFSIIVKYHLAKNIKFIFTQSIITALKNQELNISRRMLLSDSLFLLDMSNGVKLHYFKKHFG